MSWMPGIGTGLAQINNLYQTVQKAGEEEHQLLFMLRKNLTDLKGHLQEGPSVALAKASTTLQTLKTILSSSREEQLRIFDNTPRLDATLTPLQALSNTLEAYVFPNFSHPQPSIEEIQARIPAADSALNGEIERTQGIVAKVISVFFSRGTREIEHAAQKFGGNGSVATALIFRHPLLEIRHFITTFTRNEHHYLPQDREEQLHNTLKHLSYYSDLFSKRGDTPGIEEFVAIKLSSTKLSEDLPNLRVAISTFLMREIGWFSIPTHNHFYLLLYDNASKVQALNVPDYQTDEQKIDWSRQYVLGNIGDLDQDLIWDSFAQYDEIKLMEALYEKIIQSADCTNVKDFANNVDRILMYFQHLPPSQVKETTLKELSTILVSWVSFAGHFIKVNASSGKQASLEQLEKAHHAINQGKYLDAIRLLKYEVENGPMAHVLSADRDIVSPLKSFQDLTEEFEEGGLLHSQSSSSNWENQLDEAHTNLSEVLSFYTTFHLTLSKICGVLPRESQSIYNRIIAEVELHPQQKTRAFFNLLSNELDKLSEVSFFFTLIAKIVMFPIYFATRLFANHITTSALHYVKHYIQLPSKEPLGTVHIAPFENITRCFQANIAGMKDWASDHTCEKWGAKTRRKALAEILRTPKLNSQYERDELVTKSGLLAIDIFVKLSHFQSLPKTIRHNIAVNVARPSLDLPSDHFANVICHVIKSIFAFAPQIATEMCFYLFKLIDYIFNSMIQWGLKKTFLAYDVPGRIFKTLGNSLYQSQYIPVFDEIILKQLQQIEKVIDEEYSTNHLVQKESDTTRETFKEMIENLFEMIEMRHNLTKEKMSHPRKDDLPFINEHTRDVIRGLVDNNLSEALVNVFITLIQSLFNEDQMNDFLLSIVKAITASFTTAESFLSHSEKERIKSVRGAPLSEKIVQEEIKKKCYHQEREIHDSLQRIIHQSVHQVVHVTVNQVTSQKASLEYIEWMERCFYGEERGNFLTSMRKKLDAFEKPETEKKALFLEIEQDFLSFMRELEEKQIALDEEPVPHTRRLQRFASSTVLKHLQTLSTRLRKLITDQSRASCISCKEALAAFNQDLLMKKTEFRSIKAVELENKNLAREGLSGITRSAVRETFDATIPALATQVEGALCRKLDSLAQGVIRLPKDSTFTESLISHLFLIPFMDSNNCSPDLRFLKE